ncbi:helix-turn-helix domain-containing protein [Halobacillus sp. A1]|uniref:helix-turn-helix domain-containing protein n=1 Tax=Halobacillus sp. A1 TaxID=2880262 RepID=UPI0020A6292D|nr:helix-turn-helix transcriptional regulator [Halobacillus sp. A1]MCP3031951.1 helix-turn-helix domain-containing protein [Halobacillus sp. A1]
MNFGEEIKRLRKEKNLTLDKLAEKSELSKSYLSRLENNKRKTPNKETILKLARGLEVSSTVIFQLAGYKKKKVDVENILKLNEAFKNWEPEFIPKGRHLSRTLRDGEPLYFMSKELSEKDKEKIFKFIEDFILN